MASTDSVTATQEQFLGFVRDGQEAVVKAVQTWAETVSNIVPRSSEAPFGDLYRQPAETVEQAFAFSEQVLKAQREFTKNVLAAAQPVWGAAEDQAQQAAKGARSAAGA